MTFSITLTALSPQKQKQGLLLPVLPWEELEETRGGGVAVAC
jgi:hypothetical protein